MPKKPLGTLTESMFYVLMVLTRTALCGTEIADAVRQCSGSRVRLGPATLYTILGKFRDAGYIAETDGEEHFGRIRTYRLTDTGYAAYRKEYERLLSCIADADTAGETGYQKEEKR